MKEGESKKAALIYLIGHSVCAFSVKFLNEIFCCIVPFFYKSDLPMGKNAFVRMRSFTGAPVGPGETLQKCCSYNQLINCSHTKIFFSLTGF